MKKYIEKEKLFPDNNIINGFSLVESTFIFQENGFNDLNDIHKNFSDLRYTELVIPTHFITRNEYVGKL